MPENRTEAFNSKYSFNRVIRPKVRPKSIIERPDNSESNRENSFSSSEPSWSKTSVSRLEKEFIADKKINRPVKVDTSGSSIYKTHSMQVPVSNTPAGSPHEVSFGETLSDIAARNKVSVQQIVDNNKIKNANKIYAGQKIYIPRGVFELDGPEADGINAPPEQSVFDKLKSFFGGGNNIAGVGAKRAAKGPDPSGLMTPTMMAKYKIAVARDTKIVLTNNSQIKDAQSILTDMGYNPNGIDGEIGPGTRRAVRKLQAQHGLEITGVLTPKVLNLLKSSTVQEYPDKPNFKAVPISFDAKDMSIYTEVVAGIESGGEAAPYTAMGGAGNSYVGKYQLGKMALIDLNFGYTPDKIKELLANPKKQEELFKEYTNKNHTELTRISKEYREMSKQEQLGVLGYAHNQGATAAAEFLFTGVVGSDAFDTEGTKYTRAIVKALGGDFEEPVSAASTDLPELQEWSQVSDALKDRNSSYVPSHMKQFVDDILGNNVSDIKTEKFFKTTELNAMRSVIGNNITRTGSDDILKILLEGGDTSSIKLTPDQLELKLKNLGYLKLSTEEDRQPTSAETQQAIKSFQKKQNLTSDGAVGPITTDALLRMGVGEYKDYKTGTDDVRYDTKNTDALSLLSPEGAVKKTIGQFNWRIDKNGVMSIPGDQYNFNDGSDLKQKYPTKADKTKHLAFKAAQVAAGRLSVYGFIRTAAAFAGSDSGKGDMFVIDLGKAP